MLGKRSKVVDLFDVGNVFPLELKPTSFYAQLAKVAPTLFKDEDFATFYVEGKGRPSTSPALLCLTITLQYHDMVSDEEAIDRTAYDLRWAAVLNLHAGTPLCAKSTLQLFRSHLILHPEVRSIFETSIDEAKTKGLLGNKLKLALDTKPMLGRGAVKDTYNLLAEGIRKLAHAMATSKNQTLEDYLKNKELERYAEGNVKGNADLDWSDEPQVRKFLTKVVSDAKRLLSEVEPSDPKMREAACLLSQILLQDIEEKPTSGGTTEAHIKQETTPGRILSVTDPEMRHGRKSASKRFNGYKADIAVDIDSQIIVAIDVLPGDAGDAANALAQVEQAEANTGFAVSETSADCAYGGGPTRKAFDEADRTLYAKVPKSPLNQEVFPKSDFKIDVDAGSVTCPAGITITKSAPTVSGNLYHFGKACRSCLLKALCTTSRKGRSITVLEHEGLVQKARKFQATPAGREVLRKRVTVEHALARLGNLGIGQARYLGRIKNRFQLAMSAAVANFRLIWNRECAATASAA